MGWFKNLYEFFAGREKLTDAAKHIGGIFDAEISVGQQFFDAVLAQFLRFDEHNDHCGNKAFYEDVDFVTQCFNGSF
ncbi:unnamed protein product, partial [Rotaria sp. Silwood1]